MKKSLAAIVTMVLALCLSASAAASAPAETGPCSVAFRVDEKDLIPEGIAYDPLTRQFFLGSINKRKVVAISPEGKASDFVKTGQDGVLEALGMKVDAGRRRLWVLSNREAGGRHLSAIHVYHLDSKTCLKKLEFDEAEPRLLNDLALTADGGAYITDTDAGRIYRVPGDLSRLEPFLGSAELLKGANGIAISPDGALLYVAASLWITVVDLKDRTMRPAGNPQGIGRHGIDGLVYHRGGLIGVVNGVKRVEDIHIARYRLSPDGRTVESATTVDKGNPLFNIPTTCVLADEALFCLADTSLDVFLQNRMSEVGKLRPPTVLRYDLGVR